MCEPLTIATFAIAAFSSIQQFSAAESAAKEQRLLQEAQIKVNTEFQEKTIAAALQNFNNEQAQLDLRANQEREASGQQKFEARLTSLRETAAASAASGETAGLSVDALLADFAGAGGRNLQAIDTNLANTLGQVAADKEGSRANALSIFNSASTPQLRRTINGPSPLALGLDIAGAGLSSYTTYKAGLPKTPTAPTSSSVRTGVRSPRSVQIT